jgi:hypothetical protein
VGKPEGKRPLGRSIHRWVYNIKMDLREIGWDGIGLISLSIGTSGVLLWTRQWTFGFHKMFGNSWVAAQLTASQEGLSSMSEWILYTVGRSPSMEHYPIARPLPTDRAAQTQTYVSRVGFEPRISVFERAKVIHTLDHVATVIGIQINNPNKIAIMLWLICMCVYEKYSISDNLIGRISRAWGQVLHIYTEYHKVDRTVWL